LFPSNVFDLQSGLPFDSNDGQQRPKSAQGLRRNSGRQKCLSPRIPHTAGVRYVVRGSTGPRHDAVPRHRSTVPRHRIAATCRGAMPRCCGAELRRCAEGPRRAAAQRWYTMLLKSASALTQSLRGLPGAPRGPSYMLKLKTWRPRRPPCLGAAGAGA
jgi:hypothetical protein